MILSDHDIKGRLRSGYLAITPLGENAIQPTSEDLRRGDSFRVFNKLRWDCRINPKYNNGLLPIIDPKIPEDYSEAMHPCGDHIVLEPGVFVLGTTVERVTIPNDLVGRLEGKSSLARLGLVIHSTAGFIDAGFSGQITLELSNVNVLPIKLYVGMKIGQIAFTKLSYPVDTPYGSEELGSKYQNQTGATASQSHRNF
jgi:dCTP deaminase